MNEILQQLTQVSKHIYNDNLDRGFWEGGPEAHNVGEKIALMHSELSEALEAHRKDLMDDKLPQHKGLDVELADCAIRILDFCGAYNIDIGLMIIDKLAYNKTRPYKHGKAY